MKKSKLLLTLLMATLFVGFTSCDNDDDDINLKVEQSEVNIEVGEKAIVKITEGNGDYKAVPADEEIATADVKESEIVISGLKEGNTTITVTDKEGKGTVITVYVVGLVNTWNFDNTKLTFEVEANDETEELIKVDLANRNLKSITFNADKTFAMVNENEEDGVDTKTGTYTYVDKIITFATGEGENINTWTATVTELTKSSLKYTEDNTEFYKAQYPEGEVTKVASSLELTINKN